MDTQSYGLFFLFLCFLNSASRSDERLFMLYSFFFFTFSFFFPFGYSKERFLYGRPVLPPMNTRRRHRDTGHFSI